MPDQVPKAVVQERYERLVALQERISLEENQAQIGRELQVLVSTGEGKKDAETTASRAAPRTTVSCTSSCPRALSSRGPATSSP
jgi:tRNA A37 methylthiotransferase MiaB